jgi:hypothetical protein
MSAALLTPRLQRYLDDAWVLDEDQRRGGSGDAVEDACIRRLIGDLCAVVVSVVVELGGDAWDHPFELRITCLRRAR